MPTLPGATPQEPLGRASMIRLIFSPRMLVAFLMGFSCGLPLLLTGSVLQAWMSDAGVDLSLIGLLSLVGLPYTFKFLWAPFLDRFSPPVLGRRRGWLLLIQMALAVMIIGLGLLNPGDRPSIVVFVAFWVCFFSASQDVVVDAYRREDLSDPELGLGASLYVSGYRVGMLLAGGGGLILADHIAFSGVYFLMAGCMIPGMVTTLFAPEPPVSFGTPQTLRQAVLDPLIEYFSRENAMWILLFIVLYKIGDVMAGAMTTPFYLSIGYTKTQIGAVVKLFGFWATIGGGLAGGVMMLRLGIYRGLWWFGILQAVSTACFVILARIDPSVSALAGVIALENLSSGMGTAAFAAFLAGLTHKRYTATQYSLLTSIMGIPRVFAAATTGYLADFAGWELFFIFCTIIAIPGLLLLKTMKRQMNPH
jgi:MFS transporter, PAT family, beta-lactamase induction signal transducer AmpG